MATRKLTSGVREEEICRILNLKKNLDYSDILVKYAGKYMKMGWDLVAVNFKGEEALDLDFQEPQAIWSERLTGWGLEGIQVNLGVRTGAASRLMVLEVHREESLAPFNQRGDWCSGCVAEVGVDREQHYYALPKGWQPPASFFLEAVQIMVFGEGGLVLAPPPLEPRAQSNLRWLRPPWESPPIRPSQALCRLLSDHAPRLSAQPLKPDPVVLPWARIYPAISAHPPVLQALLMPAASPEAYYRELLSTAQRAGLKDPAMLLSLVWHAPLGHNLGHGEKMGCLEELVKQCLAGVEEPPKELPGRKGAGVQAGRNTLADQGFLGAGETGGLQGESEPEPPGKRGGMVEPASPCPQQAGPGRPEEEVLARGNGGPRPPGTGEFYEVMSEFFRMSRESLVVERRRYEAMIYELGKLGALQDFFKKEHRQNKALREKLEGLWNTEVDFLRRQLAGKKTKKGFYQWWWQE